LLEHLRKLEAAVSPHAATCPATLHACLGATRSDMVEHFRAQEQHGSMDTIERQQPYLATAIHRLAEDHHALTEAHAALMDATANATALDDALRANVRAWIARVRRHEAREIDFLQDAVDQDIGEKD
jgi:hypothetical protein